MLRLIRRARTSLPHGAEREERAFQGKNQPREGEAPIMRARACACACVRVVVSLREGVSPTIDPTQVAQAVLPNDAFGQHEQAQPTVDRASKAMPQNGKEKEINRQTSRDPLFSLVDHEQPPSPCHGEGTHTQPSVWAGSI